MDCILTYKKGNISKDDLIKYYKDLEKKSVTVGIHKDKGRREISKGGFTQVQNACLQEFGGTQTIQKTRRFKSPITDKWFVIKAGTTIITPSRPFIRIFLVDSKCKKQLENILQETIDEKIKRLNNIAATSTWERVGAWASAMQADMIYDSKTHPQNAPMTQEYKGQDHPLMIDGSLARDIDYKVRGR